ncbi:hypothetical protein [Hyalangium versicolor]|uniref:hypothetical protein n=1 Tax=Hyalangium versicolor TaxID=2861190 RepID=UPI001CCA1524|nr:hypothetical protein [Hyalangium versicolor]
MKNIWKKAVVGLAMSVGLAAGAALGSQNPVVELAADCCSSCYSAFTSCKLNCGRDNDCKALCMDAYEGCQLSCDVSCF